MVEFVKGFRFLLPLLFFSMIYSCQDDIDFTAPESGSSQSTYRILKGKEAAAMKKRLLDECDYKTLNAFRHSISLNAEAKLTFSDLEPLIDQSEVYQIVGKDNNSIYTYRVAHPDATKLTFYNIVREEIGASVKIVLVKYDMDEAFAIQYGQDGFFEKFTGKISFEVLSADPVFPCQEEPNEPIPVSGGSGSGPGGAGGNGPGGGGNGPGSSGGGGSGTDPGYHYSQEVVYAQYLALMIYVAPTSTPGNDGEDDEMPEDEAHKSPRYIKIPPQPYQPSRPLWRRKGCWDIAAGYC